MTELIESFLSEGPYAVVGASNDRTKFGNRVLRSYHEHGLEAFPVNPRETEIEGHTSYPALADLPSRVKHVSVVTPPHITERVVEEAAEAGVEILWLQPGAENRAAVERAGELGLGVISGGACVLVELPRRLPG